MSNYYETFQSNKIQQNTIKKIETFFLKHGNKQRKKFYIKNIYITE